MTITGTKRPRSTPLRRAEATIGALEAELAIACDLLSTMGVHPGVPFIDWARRRADFLARARFRQEGRTGGDKEGT